MVLLRKEPAGQDAAVLRAQTSELPVPEEVKPPRHVHEVGRPAPAPASEVLLPGQARQRFCNGE
jgi:hypothetical protein